ncbi:acetolactate synthase small subunit [Buchnera aphidicola (Formosaphis micheliae)]|uniref:acetolactate synthase small subunit n=1 Tax=Buchnera aphidicola TaxID=9 RepID=UPI0031B82FFF
MKRILSILLENESGALSRVVGLFSQRGYNIESLTVAPTADSSLSHINIQTIGNDQIIKKIEKQLHKLINVLKVIEIGNIDHIEREIMLIKINSTNSNIEKIKKHTDMFQGHIIYTDSNIHIIQISGSSDQTNTFLNLINNITNITEVSRSGIIGMSKI